MKKASFVIRLLKFFAIIILIPVCIASGQSFYGQLKILGNPGVWSQPQLYFLAGIIVYAVFHLFLYKPVTSYVFGHEMTHAVWTWLFLGKVSDIKVAREGGEVTVSKSNFLTTLAPYFFPFFTAVIIAVYFLVGLIWKDISNYYLIFVFLVGASWSFHLLQTFHTLRTSQDDIHSEGVIFSALLIVILNLEVIVGLLYLIFRENGVSWVAYNIDIWHNTALICQEFGYRVQKLYHQLFSK